jgi:hypothetical protein
VILFLKHGKSQEKTVTMTKRVWTHGDIPAREETAMRYQSLRRAYCCTERDYGFRDTPVTILPLSRASLLSLLELRIFSLECLRVAVNRAELGEFDCWRVDDWPSVLLEFNRYFESELCLVNLCKLHERNWVEDAQGRRHKLLVKMRSVDDLLFDFDRHCLGAKE